MVHGSDKKPQHRAPVTDAMKHQKRQKVVEEWKRKLDQFQNQLRGIPSSVTHNQKQQRESSASPRSIGLYEGAPSREGASEEGVEE